MAKPIRGNRHQPTRSDLLRAAAAAPDIDPSLARNLRDAADSVDDLADVLERGARLLNRATGKPRR